jgi:DNA-directed RNA polymerase subunit beta'
VNRNDPETAFNYEVDFMVGKKELGVIIDKCIKTNGPNKTAEVLDLIKAQGFKYSTRAAVTVGISDMVIPEVKQRYLEETDRKVDEIEKHYRNGLYNKEERNAPSSPPGPRPPRTSRTPSSIHWTSSIRCT